MDKFSGFLLAVVITTGLLPGTTSSCTGSCVEMTAATGQTTVDERSRPGGPSR